MIKKSPKKPKEGSKKFLLKSLKRPLMKASIVLIIWHLIFTGMVSSAPAYGYTRLAYHKTGEKFSFDKDRLNGLDLARNNLFISAWVKVKEKELKIRSVTRITADSMLRKGIENSCDELTVGAWIHLTQIYKYKRFYQGQTEKIQLSAYGYYRTLSRSRISCGKGVGILPCQMTNPCTKPNLSEVLGPSFLAEVANLASPGSILFSFAVKISTKVQKIDRITSGFLKVEVNGIDNRIANAFTSGRPEELTDNRVYLRNFIYNEQKHLFMPDPQPVTASSDVIFTEKEFFSKFGGLGFSLGHGKEIKLKAGTPLFGGPDGTLPKSFCIISTFGEFKEKNFENGKYFYQQVKFSVEPKKVFTISYQLIKKTEKNQYFFTPKVEVNYKEGSSVDQKHTEESLYGDLPLADPSIIRMSFCFSLVLAEVAPKRGVYPEKSTVFLYVSARVKQRLGGNGFNLNRAVELSKEFKVEKDLKGQNVDIFYKWATSDPRNSWKEIALQEYREYDGGHSNIYEVETQARSPPDKSDLGCNHFLGDGEGKVCINCDQGNAWFPSEKRCRWVTFVNPDSKCSSMQEFDIKMCQACSIKPKTRGIASPECLDESGCKPPNYNYYKEGRCDYCLNAFPNQCRCNDYQIQKDNKEVEKAKYCKCKVENCKF